MTEKEYMRRHYVLTADYPTSGGLIYRHEDVVEMAKAMPGTMVPMDNRFTNVGRLCAVIDDAWINADNELWVS